MARGCSCGFAPSRWSGDATEFRPSQLRLYPLSQDCPSLNSRPWEPDPASHGPCPSSGCQTAIVSSSLPPTTDSSANPAWYYNLKANPRCSASVRGQRQAMNAYEAEGEERERLWELDVAVYPPRNHYAQRAGSRRIPVMVLQPVAESDTR